ncbi:MAG: hypothetical protein SFV18_17620 [Bryobacteraceae bacterium]|nr:hypothetical protein [Bryobacteraceae bacterium]
MQKEKRKSRIEPVVLDDEELLDSTIELIRAFGAIKDPDKRKQLLEAADYLAKGGKIQ